MTVAGILALALVTGLIDLPRLVRRRRWRELVTASLLLAAGLALALSWAANLPLPTIGATLEWLASPLIGPQ
ncbi:MAG TPA: hypothetical protein VNT75_08355 [Symbiobacteriaceae bacterium]|nr:hypothetical protein [Symbiobacteriaceae bacterium]